MNHHCPHRDERVEGHYLGDFVEVRGSAENLVAAGSHCSADCREVNLGPSFYKKT